MFGIIFTESLASQAFERRSTALCADCDIDGFAKIKAAQKVADFLEKEERCSK